MTFRQWTSQLCQKILPELLVGKKLPRKSTGWTVVLAHSNKMKIYKGGKPHHTSVSTLAWKSIVHVEECRKQGWF